MFKSMICLFLTTSFLILNIKPGHLEGSSSMTSLSRSASTTIGPALMDGAHEMIDEQPDLTGMDDFGDKVGLHETIETWPDITKIED